MHVHDESDNSSEELSSSKEPSGEEAPLTVIKAAVSSKPKEPSRIPMRCGDAVDKYVKLAMQCVRYIDCNKLMELMKPIYDERALISQYRDELKSHSAKGEQVMMRPKGLWTGVHEYQPFSDDRTGHEL